MVADRVGVRDLSRCCTGTPRMLFRTAGQDRTGPRASARRRSTRIVPLVRRVLLALAVAAGLILAACSAEPRDLGELTVRDSVYVDPTTGTPFTGEVVRRFRDDPERVQIEGALLDGEWDGDFVAYHSNGRVRYMGSFRHGQRCGAWTENADSTALGSVYEQLVREVETMGMYPPCGDAS